MMFCRKVKHCLFKIDSRAAVAPATVAASLGPCGGSHGGTVLTLGLRPIRLSVTLDTKKRGKGQFCELFTGDLSSETTEESLRTYSVSSGEDLQTVWS